VSDTEREPPDAGLDPASWVTPRQARVLREIESGRTLKEVAEILGIEYSGVRSHIQRLKEKTGCADVREVGRWWRANRGRWLLGLAEAGGVELAELGPDGSHAGR
jgi:DNA-binding CsgD family transcriptional regulator